MLLGKQLSQGYGRHTVFRGLDIEVRPGVTALLGPNGAGKTTLLRTLATVQPPIDGSLVIGGREVRSEADARRARRQIGFLPQRFGFEPGVRVRDFVRYGAWLRGLSPADWEPASAAALAHVGLTAEAGQKMGRLSGGMRQRAAIAWAIVGQPSTVLLDEPTVGLDPQQRLRFRDIIAGLTGTTVLLSTHLIDDVDAVCDRVVIMHGGEIRFDGATDELKALDDAAMPGHTPLERAYMSLLPTEERSR
ncbi:ATP-binding cassette domain-containing protein [Micromonospora sp. WMMD961]|uniref:ABC transporter ATP-binding protein n=1 Tax=Micromonospora sp. WMMD961 TaxID=3016100 RepID=UPI002415BDF8|nr:ATP-binding cassette domain-containing protein [Micromonospora sp. WMMD961]MDG4782016.1 ATP-binding cassette domain-containing protein [Micromonospora sp. WMMD961]